MDSFKIQMLDRRCKHANQTSRYKRSKTTNVDPM